MTNIQHIKQAPFWTPQKGTMDVLITCKCGQNVTRRTCEARQEFHDDIHYVNYYCPHCGAFVRCDSTLPPLPAKEDDVTDVTDSESAK